MSNLKVAVVEDLATADTVETKYLVHGSAKAWANLDGTGTIALRDSFGISSVVDDGVGSYTFNWVNAMSDTSYSPTAGNGFNSTHNAANNITNITSATALAFRHYENNALQDAAQLTLAVQGDLA